MRDRRAILEEHGLGVAPRSIQRAFWQRYNVRSDRRTGKLGDVIAQVLSDEGLRASQRLQKIREAWQAVVPPGYASMTEVESLRSGRLRVSVTSAPARFMANRSLGPAVLTELRSRLAGIRIDRIDYCVARGSKKSPAGGHEV